MNLKLKRSESSGKIVTSTIQCKQEDFFQHSIPLQRAATQAMSASEKASPILQLYRFKLINKYNLLDSTGQQIWKDTSLLSRLQFNYLKLKDNISSISKEDYSMIYQRQYKNKKEIVDKLMHLMRGEQNRLKSEPMRSQAIEDLQQQIQALMIESTDQIQRRYRQKEDQTAEELQKKKCTKLNIKMIQLQNKLTQSEFKDKNEKIATKYRNRIKQYIKQTIQQETTELIKEIKSQEAIQQKKYQKDFKQFLQYDQTLKQKHMEIVPKLQELQKSHRKKQENYQTLKKQKQTQLLNLKISNNRLKMKKLEYLMFLQENRQLYRMQYEIQLNDKKKILREQFNDIQQRIIKILEDQKNLKIRNQIQKITKHQKILSNIKSQIETKKYMLSYSYLKGLSSIQSIESQRISQSGEKFSLIDFFQIKHQQYYQRKESGSQQVTIKKQCQYQCQIIEKQYKQKKQEKIEQNEKQMQYKIKKIQSYYESLVQQKRQEQIKIKKQIKEKDQIYLQFQTQKKKQLQLIKNEGQQEKQRYFAAKQNFRQQIQKYQIKIRSQQGQIFKVKNQKLKVYIKAKIKNALTQSAQKLIKFLEIYQQLFVKTQGNYQKDNWNYSLTDLPLRYQLQDYALWLKQYQKQEREDEKRQLDEKKYKQIQSARIKFTQMINSLNKCRNNAENIWFTEQVYQSTQKDLQFYNTFLLKRQSQLSSLQQNIIFKQFQINHCKLRLELNKKDKDRLSKQVSLFRDKIVDMEMKMIRQKDEQIKKKQFDLSGEID